MAQKREVHGLAFRLKFLGGERLKKLPETPVMWTQPALRIEHFVEEPVVLVTFEQRFGWLRF